MQKNKVETKNLATFAPQIVAYNEPRAKYLSRR